MVHSNDCCWFEYWLQMILSMPKSRSNKTVAEITVCKTGLIL